MWGVGGVGLRGSGASILGGGGSSALVRYFSRKRAENLRKINPKVPYPEASSIARQLYDVVKQRGPLSIANAWNHAKVVIVSPLEYVVQTSPVTCYPTQFF